MALAAPHERDGWLVGGGFGFGRAAVTDGQGESLSTGDGVMAQIRAGRMVGPRRLLGLEYEGWLVEQGDTSTKYRRSLQNWAVAMTWFPGQGVGNGGGLFLRVGAGVALGGRAEVALVFDPEEGIVQEHGVRDDEWGWGYLLGAGYEWRVAPHTALGLAVNFDHLLIGKDWYDSARFGGVTANLGWYF